MAKKHEIRNSTAEFLIFQAEEKEQGIEVMYADETIWCTQDSIAVLFDKGRSTIAEHLQNAFTTGELVKESVCRKFRRTATDGKEYNTQYYNLDAVISVGYRVNSIRATQFRQWAQVYYDSMLNLADVLTYLLQALHPVLCYVTPLGLMTCTSRSAELNR